jgi:peroxiredoxin
MSIKPGDIAPDFTLPATIGDSIWAHEGFAAQGGASDSLLADFQPRDEVERKYGFFLEDTEISARTAFIIGEDGKVKEVIASDIPVARDIAGLLEKARAA